MELLLAACMFAGAVLYTSVGHAGASAYLALMALFGVASTTMRPTALVLNILVASFTSFRYIKAGFFRWRVLWPILIGAVPMAFLGGYIQLPGDFYRPLVGVVLLIAAIRFLWPMKEQAHVARHDPPIPLAAISGAGVGFLSGLTGTGGGIFLSPIILLFGWSDPRTTSGIVAAFILANSISGLLGNIASVQALPAELPLFAGAVLAGAVIGTILGIKGFTVPMILKALGVVLIIAGIKLIGVF